MRHEGFSPLFKPFFACEKSIARSQLNQNISTPTLVILHFQILKKIDAAHFLDARGNEKQVSNLEWPNGVIKSRYKLNFFVINFFSTS